MSTVQWLATAAVGAGVWGLTTLPPETGLALLGAIVGVGFSFAASFRLLLLLASRRRAEPADEPAVLPTYAIVCALHDEARVVGQLIRGLSRIDYPSERLEGYLLLEADDHETRAAALAEPRPAWLHVLTVPDGRPRTKPRALQWILPRITADFLTVFDAEDEPDPFQLREAAARFRADASGRLACLQAPLRIRRRFAGTGGSPWLDRQFAAEYASLFECLLPGLARVGLPFPLGGTSNHLRVSALRGVGGWDPHNVTEDADLGFRLWSGGFTLDVLSRPTWETPPGELHAWLPQRTRWLKGHLQTLGVHTRRPWRLGARGLVALFGTLGAGVASAALHGPSLAWIAALLLVAAHDAAAPAVPALGFAVLASGVIAAWLTCAIGARRAGVPYSIADMLCAPAYWSLLSLAFCHAVVRLILEPFAWDKTPHAPDTIDGLPEAVLDGTGATSLSATHAAAPETVA